MDTNQATVPPTRRIRAPIMLAYGFGTVAYGVKDFCFSTFLLFFFNQVLGLPAAQVGFAIMCALLLDAVADPAIGFLSDRTRSRWGRRHPWMYASAIPIAVGWLLLWNPPALSDSGMLLWVFAMSVLVRTAVSAYEVPSQALTPELSADYEERTRIMSYRFLFGWVGGLGMMILAYAWLLGPSPGHPNGQLVRENYPAFSMVSAGLMAFAILVSAWGTHGEIKRLPRAEGTRQSLGAHFGELGRTVKNRAFLILMAAGLCYYCAQGVSFALSSYIYAHVWRFQNQDFTIIALSLLVGAYFAFLVAPRASRRLGKPRAAMWLMMGAVFWVVLPYVLRLAGLFPAPGTPWMLPSLFAIYVLNVTCSISATILGGSMMADVVEQSEIETGRRNEGVFFAGAFFVQKCCSGLGIWATGMLLDLVSFPAAAKPGEVPVVAVDRLTILFSVLYAVLAFAAAGFYRVFPFGKAEHEARVALLAAGKTEMSAEG
ncbi:MFS transporter [Sphingomonas kyeonggiensis]|uniref:GPH family glycoside/pentoside/hexuronide:cation symporter n=1 Tax=Sphingomonas kyeonggiensis TaxID=1268553 RepID=A0A7W6JWJ2_9SPHN|nr:MFS transporter [Sphingomonas kyeonggiensis]MBB4100848.1 GPH family glycoside/pentoside/hexuronide:cation symporter [Sphingomonas kyeonggiensis]